MSSSIDLVVDSDDVALAAVLTMPDVSARAGIVTLHPASGPGRDYVLFHHLARLLAPRGIAVLSYDRRPPVGDDDVAFDLQAGDALAAIDVLGERLGPSLPIGLWAFSQGAWVAPIVASRSGRVAFLILVGASGVSPAAQMRYSAAEALRRAGHPAADVARAIGTRVAIEAFLRGTGSHADAQRHIDAIAGEPWFDLLWLPRTLSADAGWRDMDHDPRPDIRGVRCPVLLLYGDDEVVPARESVRVWSDALTGTGAPLEVVHLPDATHLPTIGGGADIESVDPGYERAIVAWLDRVLGDGPAAASAPRKVTEP